MTKQKTADDIQEQIRLSEEKIRKLKQDQKILARKHAEQLRKERTHRLCTIGGMLEGFLKNPEAFSNDEVYELLKLAFNQPTVLSAVPPQLYHIVRRPGDKHTIGSAPPAERLDNS